MFNTPSYVEVSNLRLIVIAPNRRTYRLVSLSLWKPMPLFYHNRLTGRGNLFK